MSKYIIKEYNKDFEFIYETQTNTKGTREKKVAYDKNENVKAYFKYEKYDCSESCSEKMSYEIAKVLGYNCARIEFAKDENGTVGVLNYLFIDRSKEEHHDAKEYLATYNSDMKDYHTIDNIKKFLDAKDINLFADFIKIMVFDALIGEHDRHSENCGITIDKDGYRISTIYDNGCNLLREFKNEEIANQYYNQLKSFESYIKRPESYIYNLKTNKRFKLFDLIEYLYKKYPELITEEILNLKKLDDQTIKNIVDQVPDGLLTNIHKEYIILYLQERRNILLNIKE